MQRHKRWILPLSVTLAAIATSIGAQWLGLHIILLLRWLQWPIVCAALGIYLAHTRGRWLPFISGVVIWLIVLVVCYTPLSGVLMKQIVRDDALQPSDAVVVLASDIFADGTPVPQSKQRLNHAYDILRQGYAPLLVVTKYAPPKPSYLPAVRRQLTERGIQCRAIETAAIRYTTDEAREVAVLARLQGWRRAILVSDASHMRRAKVLFEAAGVRVLCSPCESGSYNWKILDTPHQRLAAFRDWIYETHWLHIHNLSRLAFSV
jgi:uncharacterized SAM-binding protein YcdF (DUF218 family)